MVQTASQSRASWRLVPTRQTGEKIKLVTAYDGDRAGVGRIVADSSWHHYVNINLKGFPHPAPLKSHADKIGQFYGNLAIWLAPLHKRCQMAQAMCWELADYTLLLEQQNDPIRTGEIAYALLGRSTSLCEIHEVLRALGQPQLAQRCSGNWMKDLTNTEQQTLGLVLDSYHKAMIRAEQPTVPIGSHALENSREMTIAQVASANSSGSTSINTTSESSLIRDKRPVATSTIENKEWTIEIKRDAKSGEPFTAILVFNITSQNGVVTGEVWEGLDRKFLSAVTGTHEPLPGTESWFMALEFKWGSVNVSLFGVTVETPLTVLFNGRYRASGGGETPDRRVPGDGDTGTGTGQQT